MHRLLGIKGIEILKGLRFHLPTYLMGLMGGSAFVLTS